MRAEFHATQALLKSIAEGASADVVILTAEGIDLPGSRLIGAFVATLGLPQVNSVNEEMQRRMEKAMGKPA